MVDTKELRASDSDRQQVVDRLRDALEDGRLTMDEYMDRMGQAYQAVTFGDLAPLLTDLPAQRSVAVRQDSREPVQPSAATPLRLLGRLPAPLRVMWSIWLTAVMVNVVVWVLVSGTSGHLAYPWPLWVAGPWGAVLFASSGGFGSCCSRPKTRRMLDSSDQRI